MGRSKYLGLHMMHGLRLLQLKASRDRAGFLLLAPTLSRGTRHASRLVLLAFLLAGCAVPEVPARVVYEDPTTFVRLEPDDSVVADRPETRHSHPATIGVEDMSGILRGIRVRDHRVSIYAKIVGEAAWAPVFEEEEIAVLASRLTEALAQAEEHELVTYYLSRPQTSIKREITTGGLYVQGNQLYFILANRNMVYGVPAHGLVYDRKYPTRPTAPKWFDLSFEPEGAMVDPDVNVLDYVLGREKDALVIDLGKLGLGLPVVRGEKGSQGRLL